MEIHVPSLDWPMGPEFQFNRKMACFSIYKRIRWHTYGCFICRSTGPKCIMKLVLPFLPPLVNGLLLVNIFCRMFMTLFLWCFNFTFLGWYGVAMLCLTPYSAKNCQKVLSMKCGPPSLMINRGIPNRWNITSWNIFLECLKSTVRRGNASTHLDT